jgi:putative MATE family efflux protein
MSEPDSNPTTSQGGLLVGLPALLKLGLPLVAGMGGHAFFNLIDLAMVGAYQSDPDLAELTISGVTIASLLITVPLIFVNGISNGTVAVIAQQFGAGKTKRANRSSRQALLLALALSIVLGVLPALFTSEIVSLFQVSETIERVVAEDYFKIMSYGSVTGFLLVQITANMRAIGMGMWPMVLLLTSNAGNILGNYVLIFGKWGFEPLGAPGAAWATVIARGLAIVIGVVVLFRADPAIRIGWKGWRLDGRVLRNVAGVGLPVALQWTVRMVAMLALLLVVSPFGSSVKAAFGVGTRLDTLATFAGLGWGGACAALLGQRLAQNRIADARRVALQSAVLNVITMTLLAAAFYVWAEPLIRLFSLSVEGPVDPDSVAEGKAYLRIVVFSYPFYALTIVWCHALNGAGSVKTPLLIDALGLIVIQIPLAWWWSSTGLEETGAWWAMVVSQIAMALVYWLVFRGGAWEKKRLR